MKAFLEKEGAKELLYFLVGIFIITGSIAVVASHAPSKEEVFLWK